MTHETATQTINSFNNANVSNVIFTTSYTRIEFDASDFAKQGIEAELGRKVGRFTNDQMETSYYILSA